MAEQSESSKEQQADSKATESSEQVDFNSLSLDEMEKALTVKDVEKEEVEEETELSEEKDSVSSEEEVTEDTEESSEDQASKEKEETKSEKSDKSFDVNKAYKELQAEFTRRNQESKKKDEAFALLQAEVERLKKPAQSDAKDAVEKKFAQLKKNNPNAAKFIDELHDAVKEVVDESYKEKVSPLEERVTLRTRQENLQKFDSDMAKFQQSELKDLEPEVVAIYNADPSLWQRLIFDSENAFQQLLNKAITDNLEKVVALKSVKKQADNAVKSKGKMIEKATVGKPSGGTKVIPTVEFNKLSLDEMEKALPKAD